jgi:hypothetical protein
MRDEEGVSWGAGLAIVACSFVLKPPDYHLLALYAPRLAKMSVPPRRCLGLPRDTTRLSGYLSGASGIFARE